MRPLAQLLSMVGTSARSRSESGLPDRLFVSQVLHSRQSYQGRKSTNNTTCISSFNYLYYLYDYRYKWTRIRHCSLLSSGTLASNRYSVSVVGICGLQRHTGWESICVERKDPPIVHRSSLFGPGSDDVCFACSSWATTIPKVGKRKRRRRGDRCQYCDGSRRS
jgi:hypothetical protein